MGKNSETQFTVWGHAMQNERGVEREELFWKTMVLFGFFKKFMYYHKNVSAANKNRVAEKKLTEA